jgi:predicted Rossmann fold flavoprotein
VLRRFDVPETIAFFAELGVELVREDTGKLFPSTNRARTVLDALLRAAADAGATIAHPRRVAHVRPDGGGFVVEGDGFAVHAPRVVLATGGMSLPKSGSDGHGWTIARALGHTVTPRLLPALVGLTLADGHFVRDLSGLTLETTLDVRAASGKRLATRTASTLCTHFGISGPGPMDISRHWQHAHADDAGARLTIAWLDDGEEALDAMLRGLGARSVLRGLAERLPERLVRALCAGAGVDPATPGHALARHARRALVRALKETELPVTGTRGWKQAEATAGGVPLSEVHLDTMESRIRPGRFLCGEMLVVDGRIGGYNFQWAWATGHLAGQRV